MKNNISIKARIKQRLNGRTHSTDQAREYEWRKQEEANTRFAIICQVLETIGIEVFDEYGDTRSFAAIMDEIKDKWRLLDNDCRKMLVDAFENYMI